LSDGFERVTVPRRQQNIAARSCKLQRNASADAAARAGHERDFVMKVRRHPQSIADCRYAVNRRRSN
jgi:hypothetical protein